MVDVSQQNESLRFVPYTTLDDDDAVSSIESGGENETSTSSGMMKSFVSLNYSTPMMVLVAALLTVVIGATMFGNLYNLHW